MVPVIWLKIISVLLFYKWFKLFHCRQIVFQFYLTGSSPPRFSCIIFGYCLKLFSIYLKTEGQKLMLVTRPGNCLNVVSHAYLLKFIQVNEEGVPITPILQRKLPGFLQGIFFVVCCFCFCFPKVKKAYLGELVFA